MNFIPLAKPVLKGNEKKYVSQCLKNEWISSKGDFVRAFEESFSRFCQRKYAVAATNGTTALHLALLSLGVGPGDEIIVPDLTFISPVNMIIQTGARPVLADVDPDSWTLSAEEVERKVTSKTKAIIVVHLYGMPAKMKELERIARKHRLPIIEDAAEAHGAYSHGRITGSFGEVSCFSFFGNKIITTGEGGICLTNKKSLADKIRLLASHGMDPQKKYNHKAIAFNYRLTNLQAAIGLAQMEQIDSFLEKRQAIASFYSELLSGIKGIILPFYHGEAKPVCWLYSVLVEKERDFLVKELLDAGIETRPFFIPVHKMALYQGYGGGEKFPRAEFLSTRGINLPTYPGLTKNEIRYIAGKIKEIIK